MGAQTQLTDSDIDAILDKGGDNRFVLAARIDERRRKRAHAVLKAAQPVLDLAAHPQHESIWKAVSAAALAPITPADAKREAGELEHLQLTVHDCFDAGNFDDAVFALVRLWRCMWAYNMPQLGPIELPVGANGPIGRTGEPLPSKGKA